MAHDGWNCCFSFRAIFCPFTTQTAQNMIISKKWKQMPGDIIILHMSTINQDHMLYGSWDVKCKGKSFTSFCTFLLFDPSNNPKNQNSEKIKQHLEILSFYTCVPQMTIISCMVLEISSMTNRIFVILGYFLPFYPPENQTFEKMNCSENELLRKNELLWKSNFWKNEEKILEILLFYTWVP